MNNLEIKRIYQQFKYIFEINAWYGTPILKVLETIDEQQALVAFNGSHNIAELVHHMTAWRIFAIKKLEGNVDYDVSPEMNFVKIEKQSREEWQNLINNLKESQKLLLAEIKKHDDSILDKTVPPGIAPRIYSYYVLLTGLLQHDIYHLGQIVILQKGQVANS